MLNVENRKDKEEVMSEELALASMVVSIAAGLSLFGAVYFLCFRETKAGTFLAEAWQPDLAMMSFLSLVFGIAGLLWSEPMFVGLGLVNAVLAPFLLEKGEWFDRQNSKAKTLMTFLAGIIGVLLISIGVGYMQNPLLEVKLLGRVIVVVGFVSALGGFCFFFWFGIFTPLREK